MKTLDLARLLSMPELDRHLGQVQQGLEKAVAQASPGIRDPALRVIRASGKRLRPSLLLAVATSHGVPVREPTVSAAVSIELVHIASLVHDDIIDNAAVRWKSPTIHAKEGLHQAILVGDYLFARAGGIAAAVHPDAARIISDTITTLCNGESRELATRYDLTRSIEDMEKTVHDKTTALIAAACSVGAICAGFTPAQTGHFARFGQEFGTAFQLIDDILDLVSSPQLIGKPAGADILDGIYTLPLLLGLQGSQAGRVRDLIIQMPGSLPNLRELLLAEGAIEQTLQRVRRHNQAASRALNAMDDIPGASCLAVFPDVYLRWALQRFAPGLGTSNLSQ